MTPREWEAKLNDLGMPAELPYAADELNTQVEEFFATLDHAYDRWAH